MRPRNRRRFTPAANGNQLAQHVRSSVAILTSECVSGKRRPFQDGPAFWIRRVWIRQYGLAGSGFAGRLQETLPGDMVSCLACRPDRNPELAVALQAVARPRRKSQAPPFSRAH